MADDQKTVVTYDVSDAVNQLGKLDNAVKQSEGTATKSFAAMRKSSSALDTAIGTALGGIALKIGENAIPILQGLTLAIAENVFGWERANAAIEEYATEFEHLREIQKAGSDIQVAQVDAALQKQIRDLREAAVPLRQESAENQFQQQGLQKQLTAQKAYYGELDKLADASAKKRADLEERLADLQSSIADRRFKRGISGGTDAFQASQLIAEADRLAREGQFDRSEGLLDDALGKAGDNLGLIRQAEEGFDRLQEAVKKAAKEAGAKATADAAAAATQKSIVDGIQAEIQALKDRNAILSRDLKLNKAEIQGAKVGAEEARLTLQLSDAQKNLKGSLNLVAQQLTTNRGLVEQYLDAFQGFFTGDALLTPEAIDDQQSAIRTANDRAISIATDLTKNPTPETAAAVQPQIENLSKLVSAFESADESFADALKPEVERLRTLVGTLQQIQESITQTTKASTALEGIVPPQRPVAPPVAPAPGQGGAAPAAAAPKNVNVQASVSIKGGQLDQATIQQITAIVARNIRAGIQDS